MKSFTRFLTEIKMAADYRQDKEAPFWVAHHAYNTKPARSSMSLHPLRSTMYADDGSKEEQEHMRRAYSSALIVRPKEKKIDLDVSSQAQAQTRRPNTKIGNWGSKFRKSTPILGADHSAITHHDLRKVLHDLSKVHDVSDYTITGQDEHEGKRVRDFLKEKTPHEKYLSGEEFTAYHGTSKKRAEGILKGGLRPGNRTEDYPDLVKGYSEHNTYLTTSPATAANYATRESINDKSDPVVLKVRVHPSLHDKIRKDEDSMHWAQSSADPHLLKRFRDRNPGTLPKGETEPMDFHFKNLSGPDGKMRWPVRDEWMDPEKIPRGVSVSDYKEKLGKEAAEVFTKSPVNLNSRDTFAVRGSIHPRFLSVHKAWKRSSTSSDPSQEEWASARDEMKRTVRTRL